MSLIKSILFVIAILVSLVVHAEGEFVIEDPEISIGDKAPVFEAIEWLTDEKVEAYEDGHYYLVVFWATWCGPCVDEIPKLNELQKQLGDKLTVIGLTFEASGIYNGENGSNPGDYKKDLADFLDNNKDSDKAANYPTALIEQADQTEWFKKNDSVRNPFSIYR